MPGVVSLRGVCFLISALVLCICMLALVSFSLAGTDENGTAGTPGEKLVENRVPLTPDMGENKTVEAKEPDSLAAGDVTPSPAASPLSDFTGMTVAGGNDTADVEEPSLNATPPPEPARMETVVAGDSDDDFGDEEEEDPSPEPTLERFASLRSGAVTMNTTPSSEPAGMETVIAGDSDDDFGDEEEEDPSPEPTLERFAPPRPGATMAKAHYSHDSPLVQGGHQLVNPVSSHTTGGSVPVTSSSPAIPIDGLAVRGIGVLLDRTPENVALTRGGVEIANLDWLLDTAMRLGGRHPRVALEGETFTVTVTVEAQNVSVTEGSPAYVVLVPPPAETGVYEITRTRSPASLRDGERAVWEFSVLTCTGRLVLSDLTLPEERLLTSLTSNPDIFSFRAYACVDGQEMPSVGVSDPVIAVRPEGCSSMPEGSPLPGLYALTGTADSALRPSETMTGAWTRGVAHDTIVAAATRHFAIASGLGSEDVAAVYELEGGGGAGEQSASSPSMLDMIIGFFQGLFGVSPS